MARRDGGGRATRVLIVGAGVFGHLAAEEARRLGWEAITVHRKGRLRTDASDATGVAATLRVLRPQAVLLTAGPAARLKPGAAEAAQRHGLPYADLAEDTGYQMRVRGLGGELPLLTGLSTTPALAEALASLVVKRAPDMTLLRATLYAQAGNPRGRATLEFAARSRVKGGAATVELPHFGTVRAWPAQASFAPPANAPARFYVGLSGLAGVGWRWARLPALHRLGRLVPAFGGTGGALVVDAVDADGFVVAREGLWARADAQRMAVLPALWGLREALAGRAPRGPALPAEWVDHEALVKFVSENGFERVRTG